MRRKYARSILAVCLVCSLAVVSLVGLEGNAQAGFAPIVNFSLVPLIAGYGTGGAVTISEIAGWSFWGIGPDKTTMYGPVGITGGSLNLDTEGGVTLTATLPGDVTARTVNGTWSNFSTTDSASLWEITLTGMNALDNSAFTMYSNLLYKGSLAIVGSQAMPYSLGLAAVSVVPIPAAIWFFAPGLLGLIGLRRRLPGLTCRG